MEGIEGYIEKHKAKALELLSPFGFEDDEDPERPGSIWHSELKQSFDISATDPTKIVLLVYKLGVAHGGRQTRAQILHALGLA